MNLVILDAYPRGQVIVNLDNVSIIRESDNDTFVQVPHTMLQLIELIGARGLKE